MELTGNVLTPDGWLHGSIKFGSHIKRIEGVPADPAGNGVDYVLPGFVDLHVHGGGGADIMHGGGAIDTVTRLHGSHGTTSLLATTMTAPLADLNGALSDLARACRARAAGGARVLGVHLEGPYINPGKLGAQPNFARPAALDEIHALMQVAPIKLITVAPEVPGHLAFIRALTAEGITVQIGHTLGSYEDGVAALEHGASGFTHLFNAMTGLHHREPGVVGAALAHARYSELIPDLLHVHPGAIRAALRAIPRLYCVTDSTAAAGMPDGDYVLGHHRVTKCLGGVRLPDGTLAGSTLTMDQALRNLMSLGLELADAACRLSTYPADYLRLTDRGRLTLDAYADIVVLGRGLEVKSVFSEGESLDVVHA